MMLKKLNPGVWGGICFLIFSLVFFFQSFQFDYTASDNPGPGFFPVWLSGILAILSIVYIIQSVRTQNHGEEDHADKESISSKVRNKVFFVILSMLLFPVMLLYLGFCLSSFIFLLLLFFRSYKWYISAAISIVVTIVVFWLFGYALSIPLPVNGWGF